MKKVALITTNKILAQSLDYAMKSMANLDFDLTLLLNSHQALLDAEILQIDVALIDVMEKDTKERTLSFCEGLHNSLPDCHILLILSQDDQENRIMATQAKKKKIIDDYVFYDTSLKYLFAKISAF